MAHRVPSTDGPVLILTARELFGQFHFGEFSELYGTDSQLAHGIYMRGEIRELCEFTQRLYLGTLIRHPRRVMVQFEVPVDQQGI